MISCSRLGEVSETITVVADAGRIQIQSESGERSGARDRHPASRSGAQRAQLLMTS